MTSSILKDILFAKGDDGFEVGRVEKAELGCTVLNNTGMEMERKGGDDVKLGLERRERSPAKLQGSQEGCSRGWIAGCRFQKRYFGVKTRNGGCVQVLLGALAVQCLT